MIISVDRLINQSIAKSFRLVYPIIDNSIDARLGQKPSLVELI